MTIANEATTELDADDVASIRDHFAELEDPRSSINRKHLLGDLIVIAICGVLGGADGPQAIGVWAAAHADWLHQMLELPNGIPSHDTIGRLLAALKPSAFQKCFQTWITNLRSVSQASENSNTLPEPEIVAIDGKALRRSHDHKHGLGPLFLVSAWSVQRGISLGQLATAEKSNEITAIPELIDNIALDGATVTIDAAGCQKNIAAKIIDGGGNFVLALKGNQETLHRSVVEYVQQQMQDDFAAAARHCVETNTGHGRVDTIDYYQFQVPEWLPGLSKWKGLRTVGVAIRNSLKGDQQTQEVRFYISSLKLGVKRFATAVRGHWGIENTLHWCLDVTFREDESRLRQQVAANNIAWLKRFGISLLKQQQDNLSIAMRRRLAGWNTDYLAQVLGLSEV